VCQIVIDKLKFENLTEELKTKWKPFCLDLNIENNNNIVSTNYSNI